MRLTRGDVTYRCEAGLHAAGQYLEPRLLQASGGNASSAAALGGASTSAGNPAFAALLGAGCVPRSGHAVDEADFVGVGVGVGQDIEARDGGAGQGELSVELLHADLGWARGISGLRPLGDEIVLHARDCAVDEEAFAGKRFHVGDVAGGKLGGHLDDDAAFGEIHVERVLWIERTPFDGLRGGDHFRWRRCVAFRRRGNGAGGGSRWRLAGAKRERSKRPSVMARRMR